MAAESADAVVLGAGISGAALARHLARAHFGRIVVCDPRTPGAGATGRAAGIVTEQMWDRWDLSVVRETMADYEAVASHADRTAYRVNGFVRWTAREEVGAIVRESAARLRSWGVRLEEVSADAVLEKLPWVKTGDLLAATYAPDDAIVAPSRMGELLVQDARRLGVEFELGAPVDRVRSEAGSWALEVGGRSLRTRTLAVAAGAWSKRLLASIGHPLPLVPYRTQAALLAPSQGAGGEFPSFHDLDVDVYGRPEEAGRVLVGDGTESVEADPENFVARGDERFLEHLAQTFEARLPGWSDASLVRAWAGVCVATPDRRPLIGPVPGAPGLHVLTGFNGFGVMRASGAAHRLAAALGEPEKTAELLGPVLPRRFPLPFPAFAPRPGFTLEGGTNPRF